VLTLEKSLKAAGQKITNVAASGAKFEIVGSASV